MGLDVIRVPVRAVRRVGDHDIRPLLAEHGGHPAGGVVQRRCVERARIVVARRPGHPGVAVSEELLPVDTEDLARAHEFSGPHGCESRAHRGGVHVVDIALLATRGRQQDDTLSFVMRAQHDAARRDAFIVGVCVNEQQCGHAESRDAKSETTRLDYAATRRSALSNDVPVGVEGPHGAVTYAKSETTRFLPWRLAAYRLRSA
jgi:hypothetical protein